MHAKDSFIVLYAYGQYISPFFLFLPINTLSIPRNCASLFLSKSKLLGFSDFLFLSAFWIRFFSSSRLASLLCQNSIPCLAVFALWFIWFSIGKFYMILGFYVVFFFLFFGMKLMIFYCLIALIWYQTWRISIWF